MRILMSVVSTVQVHFSEPCFPSVAELSWLKRKISILKDPSIPWDGFLFPSHFISIFGSEKSPFTFIWASSKAEHWCCGFGSGPIRFILLHSSQVEAWKTFASRFGSPTNFSKIFLVLWATEVGLTFPPSLKPKSEMKHEQEMIW